jgi:hypothetical protein
LWATLPKNADALTQTVPGVLRAFAALPKDTAACDLAPGTEACLLPELWNSLNEFDDLGNFAKYAAPTIANGRVYAPTFSGALRVYGLFESARPSPPRMATKVSHDSATFVRQSPPPTRMEPGQRVDVDVTMRNMGATAWQPGASTGLLSENPNGNSAWRRDSIVKLTRRVEPGSDYTFRFRVTAPREAIVHFQWRMIADGLAFGPMSTDVEVSVVGPRCAGLRQERDSLVAAQDDTLGARFRGSDHSRAATRMATQLSEIDERLSKAKCAMEPDATSPKLFP